MRARSLLIAGLALLLLPATASAKAQKKVALGPVVTATATGPVITTPGGISIATATCPKRLRALGGGYTAPFGAAGAMVVTSSYRSSPSSWQATGTLVAGSGAATAYVYCRRGALRVTDVTTSAVLASGSGQSTTVTADCSGRAIAISGGFQMTSGPEPAHLPIPETSIGVAPARGKLTKWQVVAQNSNTGDQTITAHAYCATGIKAFAFRQDQASASVPVFESLTPSSTCTAPPKRKRVKGKGTALSLSAGGFSSPFATGVLPVHADSRIAGNGFLDTAVNGGSETGPLTVHSQAICF